MSALVDDVVSATGLPVSQVEPAIGLALTKLKEVLDPSEFQRVIHAIPEADQWMHLAPAVKKGFLSYIAGDKASILLELSQGLSQLGIPTAKQKPLAKALGVAMELHHPDLVPLYEKLKG